jgi:hypothetical protein
MQTSKLGADEVPNWASSAFAGKADVFQTLHYGLTVGLVATPRDELKTCKRADLVSTVLASNSDSYDFIPVLEENPQLQKGFIGLFHASACRKSENIDGAVGKSSWLAPLAEGQLIGADASILEFVLSADGHPCRLVVSGSQIVGLVTLSDLQKLPVRAALFALITGFEITMVDYIKATLPEADAWMQMLKPNRREKIKEEISIAVSRDVFVDELLYTQFCDKIDIIKRLWIKNADIDTIARKFRQLEKLRNSVAHANEYAASPSAAKNVCEVVRDLLDIHQQMRERVYRDVN